MTSEPDGTREEDSVDPRSESKSQKTSNRKKARRASNPSPPIDLDAISRSLSHPKVQWEVKPRESNQEADHRLWKDRLSFLTKEVAPSLIASAFILATGLFCFYTLLKPSASEDSKKWAQSAVTVLLSGVVGFVFGKASEK